MKEAYFCVSDHSHEGISIRWTRSRGALYVSGWYDGFVGIQGEEVPLREFLQRIGITEADVRKAFKEAKP
jgi:hypothetical protein